MYEYVRNKHIQGIQFIQKHLTLGILIENNFIGVTAIQTNVKMWTICNNVNVISCDKNLKRNVHKSTLIIFRRFIKVPEKVTHYIKPASSKQ
jgi:hypothetical protein